MTKEELEKEAVTTVQWECTQMIDRPTFINGYITGAEPREKRIEELEKKLTEKVTLESLDVVSRKIAELEEAKANLEYLLEGRDNEIDELKKENKNLAQNLEDTEICENGWKNRVKELEAQIEKIKSDIREMAEQADRNGDMLALKRMNELFEKWKLKE